VSSDKDPTQTYVLEETAITKVSSLEELAQMALREDEKSRHQDVAASDGRPNPRSSYTAPRPTRR
jgi:hypothetical protein